MKAISLVMSKSCFPVYNVASINKINFGTSNKMDVIPYKSSNLHCQRICPFVANKPKLKHGAYSSSASNNVTGWIFEEPEVRSGVVPYILLGVGTIGMTLLKAWDAVFHFVSTKEGFLKSKVWYCILLASAIYVTKDFLVKIVCGFAVLRDKPFKTGDIIQVGYLKGQVLEMGVMTTSLLTVENHRLSLPTCWFYGQVIKNKSRATTVVPYSSLCGEVIVNKPPQAPWHAMVSKIFLDQDEFDKIPRISEEIVNMMRSNSNVFLDKYRQPYCFLDKVDTYCELALKCYLKQMSEDEIYLVKQDLLLQSVQIIEKHGVTLGGKKGE